MTATHTPGPWRINGECRDVTEGRLSIEVDDDYYIAEIDSGPCQLANARLIAAAPEMLQLLQLFAEFARSGGDFGYPLGSLQELNEVIDKATGQS